MPGSLSYRCSRERLHEDGNLDVLGVTGSYIEEHQRAVRRDSIHAGDWLRSGRTS